MFNKDDVELSCNDAYELTDNEVADNLADIVYNFGLDVKQTKRGITITGDYDSWREFMNSFKEW